jgi:Ca2+-binding RTX toxin-like protein
MVVAKWGWGKRGEGTLRRATFFVLVMLTAMLLATGAAIAITLTGGPGNDVLYGTTASDTLRGEGGSDALYGRPGNDFLYGGPGNDNFENTAVDKQGISSTAGLRGAGGDDSVYGEGGDDDVIGHTGNDTLDDSSSSGDWDRAFGGTEVDVINVADADVIDEVSCGDGNDTATITVERSGGTITAADDVYDCETIKDQSGASVRKEDLPPQSNATAPLQPSS